MKMTCLLLAFGLGGFLGALNANKSGTVLKYLLMKTKI